MRTESSTRESTTHTKSIKTKRRNADQTCSTIAFAASVMSGPFDGAFINASIMALEQTDVRPEVFLRAQPQTMKDTLQYIRQKYGGINKYLDRYGFTDTYRNKLRNTLLVF